MKQKLKRFMAGFMAMLTLVGTLFTNGTTAFAASPQANIAFWNASVKNSGEVSELKPGYNHGKILYSILDGNSAYCMNFGLRADGGQLMNSYDDASTSMSAQQRKLLSYCLYYGFNSTQKAAPSNSQCDEYIATQAMVWVIVADIFGTGSGDSAARKLCNTAPSPDSSYSYYERLRDNISSSYNATLPSFASRRTSEAPTYELKWNEGSQRFETTLSDSNGVLSDFDFGISGYSVDKNGNSITISSTSVNTTATTGTFTSNAGKVETTSSCVFWLTGKSGYQEFISERPTADPVKAYIKVKTENIGYGELTKTDESSGVKLSGAVYGIYSDSGCTNRVQTMTTDGNGYAKSAALVAGTYYVKEITAPKGYVLSGKVHTLTVRAGQTTGISATDKEQLGAITIYKEGEVLSSWNAGSFVSADTYLVIPEGVYRSMNPRGTAYGYLWVDCDKKDVASVEQSLNTLISNASHIKMDTYHAQLQSAEFASSMMKLGCYLFMAVVGFIGFMNMANTMIMNITTKKQEYGVLQAVGMTNKQLNLCLQLQELMFTVGTICVALIIGLPLGYALFSYAKHNGIFGMNIYHVPIVPIFIMIFLVGLLQIVLSCVLSSNLKKETLVERIRYDG